MRRVFLAIWVCYRISCSMYAGTGRGVDYEDEVLFSIPEVIGYTVVGLLLLIVGDCVAFRYRDFRERWHNVGIGIRGFGFFLMCPFVEFFFRNIQYVLCFLLIMYPFYYLYFRRTVTEETKKVLYVWNYLRIVVEETYRLIVRIRDILRDKSRIKY